LTARKAKHLSDPKIDLDPTRSGQYGKGKFIGVKSVPDHSGRVIVLTGNLSLLSPGEQWGSSNSHHRAQSAVSSYMHKNPKRKEIRSGEEQLKDSEKNSKKSKQSTLRLGRVEVRRESEIVEEERREVEGVETARREAERAEIERAEAGRREVERAEAARREAERVEVARREAERVEEGRREAERAEAVRLEMARRETERVEEERREVERAEVARREAERVEAARREAERVEEERREAERAEAARREVERVEAERGEAERVEAMREEVEGVEAARREAERAEAIREEVEGVEASRREAERIEAARREVEREGVAGDEAEKEEGERDDMEGVEVRREEEVRAVDEREGGRGQATQPQPMRRGGSVVELGPEADKYLRAFREAHPEFEPKDEDEALVQNMSTLRTLRWMKEQNKYSKEIEIWRKRIEAFDNEKEEDLDLFDLEMESLLESDEPVEEVFLVRLEKLRIGVQVEDIMHEFRRYGEITKEPVIFGAMHVAELGFGSEVERNAALASKSSLAG
jgi:hypothetical protein